MIFFLGLLICVLSLASGFLFGYAMEKRRQRLNAELEARRYMQGYCERDIEATQKLFELFQNTNYKPYSPPDEIRKDL